MSDLFADYLGQFLWVYINDILIYSDTEQDHHKQNLKTSSGPPRGVIVPLVLVVHHDPPWSTSSVKFQKVWIRMDQSGPGGPRGPHPLLVDQQRSGPPWTTLRHFPYELKHIAMVYDKLKQAQFYASRKKSEF